MNSLKTVLAAGLVVSLLVPNSWGQQPQRGFPDRGRRFVNPLMEALDLDADGEISATELSKAASTLKKLDKNGDGQITRDEVGIPGGQPQGSRFGSQGSRFGGAAAAGEDPRTRAAAG